MALRQTAHEVDLRQAVPDGFGPGFAPMANRSGARAPEERILVHVTSHPHTAALIRRARRVADFLQAEFIAVRFDRNSCRTIEEANLEKHLTFARNLHINMRHR